MAQLALHSKLQQWTAWQNMVDKNTNMLLNTNLAAKSSNAQNKTAASSPLIHNHLRCQLTCWTALPMQLCTHAGKTCGCSKTLKIQRHKVCSASITWSCITTNMLTHANQCSATNPYLQQPACPKIHTYTQSQVTPCCATCN